MCGYNEYAFDQNKCKSCPIGGECIDGIVYVEPGITLIDCFF